MKNRGRVCWPYLQKKTSERLRNGVEYVCVIVLLSIVAFLHSEETLRDLQLKYLSARLFSAENVLRLPSQKQCA